MLHYYKFSMVSKDLLLHSKDALLFGIKMKQNSNELFLVSLTSFFADSPVLWAYKKLKRKLNISLFLHFEASTESLQNVIPVGQFDQLKKGSWVIPEPRHSRGVPHLLNVGNNELGCCLLQFNSRGLTRNQKMVTGISDVKPDHQTKKGANIMLELYNI